MHTFKKQPWEQFLIDVDFAAALDVDEHIDIAQSSVMATLRKDGSDHDEVLKENSMSVNGTKIYIGVTGGVNGSVYRITFRAVTDKENRYEQDVFMKVEEV